MMKYLTPHRIGKLRGTNREREHPATLKPKRKIYIQIDENPQKENTRPTLLKELKGVKIDKPKKIVNIGFTLLKNMFSL